jgi:acyl-CoA thioester hydrolase
MTGRHEFRRLIQETDLDLFGHVNNAAYLRILEEARWDLITRNGYGLEQIRQFQAGPTILEIQLKFLRELTNREIVTIETEAVGYQGKVGSMRQRIVKQGGVVACEANMSYGLFDLRARRLIEPNPEWARAIGITR